MTETRRCRDEAHNFQVNHYTGICDICGGQRYDNPPAEATALAVPQQRTQSALLPQETAADRARLVRMVHAVVREAVADAVRDALAGLTVNVAAPNVNVSPTPVTVLNNHPIAVDATPRGDLRLDYDRDGRLQGLTRAPAKADA